MSKAKLTNPKSFGFDPPVITGSYPFETPIVLDPLKQYVIGIIDGKPVLGEVIGDTIHLPNGDRIEKKSGSD